MLLRRMSKKYFAMYSWLNEELTKLVRMEWQRKNFSLDSNNCILYNKCNINDTEKVAHWQLCAMNTNYTNTTQQNYNKTNIEKQLVRMRYNTRRPNRR